MSLSSAAVFHRTPANEYERTASTGWPVEALKTVGRDHCVVLYLSAEEQPIALNDAFSRDEALPSGTAMPTLAVPFVVRHQVIGFVLFGSHVTGAQPDNKDVELLREFINRATAAYDHVAAEERISEIRMLLDENCKFQTEKRTLHTEIELLRSLVKVGGHAE